MSALSIDELYSLEQYAKMRQEFRARVMAHKKFRQVALGPNATLYFEDRLTIQYQVQEMLRIERIFEEEGIRDELEAYTPLIPDGSNMKATFMIEYADPEERRVALAAMLGIENQVWMRVGGHEKIWAIADEDLDRATQEKTSAVHFLRFEFGGPMIAALKNGANLSVGIHHDHYRHAVEPLGEEIRASLIKDLD